MPESITIKGSPGLHVPLGSPFASLKEEDRLENLISQEKIEKMIEASSDKDKDMKIHKIVNPFDPEVLTYLVEYKLDSIPLDLQKYMHGAIDDTKPYTIRKVEDQIGGETYFIDGDGVPRTDEISDNPFMRIPLYEMKKFVKVVRRDPGRKFGLEISVDDPALTPIEQQALLGNLKNYLQLKIPGILKDYTPGDWNPDDPTKLQFVNEDGTPFTPLDDLINGELLIYAKISGVCSGTIKPAIVYEWKEAVIYTPVNSSIHEKYTIGKNSLRDLFDGAASFKEVSGYVYIYGTEISNSVSNSIKMTYTYSGGTISRVLKAIKNQPDFAGGKLTPASFDDEQGPLNMTEFFNKADEEVEVDIRIPELLIKNGDFDKNKTIECKLCVLIPLDLKVSETPGVPDTATVDKVKIKDVYVPLNLGDVLKYGNETGDLFGREEGEGNIIRKVDYVDIMLKDIDITILDPKRLAVLIESNGIYKLLKFDEANAPLRFSGESIDNPFNPEFTILLKKDEKEPGTYETFGSFKILRPGPGKASKFDFKLDVKAKAALEFTLNL
jgi:hypothetical protein